MAISSRGESGIGGGSRGMTIGSGRAASSPRGSSKKPVKQALKNAKKAKPLTEPKSAVKVKPAAKPVGKSLNVSQYKYEAGKSIERASNKFLKPEPGTRKQNVGKAKSFRKFMSKNPNVSKAEDWAEKSIGPKKNTVKIKTQENLNSKNFKKALEEFKFDRVKQAGVYSDHPGGASLKSNQRLVKKGKWSTPKQIARYQKQEVKEDIKANARGLKAANKKKK